MTISPPLGSFTRLNANVKDLLIYIFGLSSLEIDCLFMLMKLNKELTIDELAKKLDRDRTTVFRSLQKLVKEGLCSKDSKSLKEQGYIHLYNAIDKDTFKMEIERRIELIKESFDRVLTKLEKDIDMVLSKI